MLTLKHWTSISLNVCVTQPLCLRLTCEGRLYFLQAVTWAMTLAWLSLLTLMPLTLMMHCPGWRPATAATVPDVRQRQTKLRGAMCQGQGPSVIPCRWQCKQKVSYSKDFYSLYLELCFLFGSSGGSVREHERRGCCLSAADLGLSEGRSSDCQGLQLSEGSACLSEYPSCLLRRLLK